MPFFTIIRKILPELVLPVGYNVPKYILNSYRTARTSCLRILVYICSKNLKSVKRLPSHPLKVKVPVVPGNEIALKRLGIQDDVTYDIIRDIAVELLSLIPVLLV